MRFISSLSQKERHFARREKVYGQFLTPFKVADFMVRFIIASGGQRNLGIDPACGNGVFLKALIEAGYKEAIGLEIDPKVLSQLPLETQGKIKVFQGDGLQPFPFMERVADAVVGNPPFSAKYGRITEQAMLSNFKLGKGKKSQAIEILFLERFLQLASSNGIIGIILPQGVFSALPLRSVRKFIKDKVTVLGVISLPRGIFSHRATSKTCILFARKGKGDEQTFMGVAQQLDDLPILLEAYTRRQERISPLAFWVKLKVDSFEPEYYWASRVGHPKFRDGLKVKNLGELLYEIRNGATEYGERRKFVEKGLRFISAKVITPLGIDWTHHKKFIEPGSPMDKKRAYVSINDVLFVRVGVGCSGRVAAVTDEEDTGIADDWIYILRSKQVSSCYLALFFYTKLGKRQIEALKRGVGTVNIPQKLLKQVLIPIPSLSLQEAIEKGYRKMVGLRRGGHLEEAKALFKEMIANIEDAISGT